MYDSKFEKKKKKKRVNRNLPFNNSEQHNYNNRTPQPTNTKHMFVYNDIVYLFRGVWVLEFPSRTRVCQYNKLGLCKCVLNGESRKEKGKKKNTGSMPSLEEEGVFYFLRF